MVKQTITSHGQQFHQYQQNEQSPFMVHNSTNIYVSESYVILYCEKNVICNSSIKICLNQQNEPLNAYFFSIIIHHKKSTGFGALTSFYFTDIIDLSTIFLSKFVWGVY
jgi:hypothetical protein